MISTTYLHNFLSSAVFTIVVETAVLFFLLRFVIKNKDINSGKVIFAGFFASLATIPYVWFVFPYILEWPRKTSLLFSEPFAFIIEAIFYKGFLKIDTKTSLILSLVCNLSSYFLGPFLRSQGLWIYW